MLKSPLLLKKGPFSLSSIASNGLTPNSPRGGVFFTPHPLNPVTIAGLEKNLPAKPHITPYTPTPPPHKKKVYPSLNGEKWEIGEKRGECDRSRSVILTCLMFFCGSLEENLGGGGESIELKSTPVLDCLPDFPNIVERHEHS